MVAIAKYSVVTTGASYSDSMPFLHRFTSCSKIIDRQGLEVTEFSFLILWLKKHMSSKAGRLVQVSVCRADSVLELNCADSGGVVCPSLDSLNCLVL